MKMNFNRPLILASKSPRRQQLLSDLGLVFEVRTKDVKESYPEELNYKEVPGFLAAKKAKALLNEIQDEIVIASDTIVVCDGQILGKPKDGSDASVMLHKLSGKEHQVITGICLLSKEKEMVFSDTTSVLFKILSQDEIAYYITNFKPFDKAGSYGIQEWIGMVGITSITGSYYTVMGLPIHRLYEELTRFND